MKSMQKESSRKLFVCDLTCNNDEKFFFGTTISEITAIAINYHLEFNHNEVYFNLNYYYQFFEIFNNLLCIYEKFKCETIEKDNSTFFKKFLHIFLENIDYSYTFRYFHDNKHTFSEVKNPVFLNENKKKLKFFLLIDNYIDIKKLFVDFLLNAEIIKSKFFTDEISTILINLNILKHKLFLYTTHQFFNKLGLGYHHLEDKLQSDYVYKKKTYTDIEKKENLYSDIEYENPNYLNNIISEINKNMQILLKSIFIKKINGDKFSMNQINERFDNKNFNIYYDSLDFIPKIYGIFFSKGTAIFNFFKDEKTFYFSSDHFLSLENMKKLILKEDAIKLNKKNFIARNNTIDFLDFINENFIDKDFRFFTNTQNIETFFDDNSKHSKIEGVARNFVKSVKQQKTNFEIEHQIRNFDHSNRYLNAEQLPQAKHDNYNRIDNQPQNLNINFYGSCMTDRINTAPSFYQPEPFLYNKITPNVTLDQNQLRNLSLQNPFPNQNPIFCQNQVMDHQNQLRNLSLQNPFPNHNPIFCQNQAINHQNQLRNLSLQNPFPNHNPIFCQNQVTDHQIYRRNQEENLQIFAILPFKNTPPPANFVQQAPISNHQLNLSPSYCNIHHIYDNCVNMILAQYLN